MKEVRNAVGVGGGRSYRPKKACSTSLPLRVVESITAYQIDILFPVLIP